MTVVWAALVGSGVAFSINRQAELASYIQLRTPLMSRSIQQLLDRLRLSALLASARSRLGEPLALAATPAEFRIWLLQPAKGGYRVVEDTAPLAPASTDSIAFIKTPPVTSAADAKLLFWPEDKPEAVLYCAVAQPPQIVCSHTSLGTLGWFISTSAGMLEHRLTTANGAVLNQSADFNDDNRFTGLTSIEVGDVTLHVAVQPNANGRRTFGIRNGYYFAAAATVSYILALLLILSRQSYRTRQLALEDAIDQSRSEGEDLVRATLRETAASAGVLVWLLHDDESLELIGPWENELGLAQGLTTLSSAAKVMHDSETIRTGLLKAIARREAWSRLMTVELDGEVLTFQGTCSPLLGGDGRLIAMLGVTSNITAALATNAQASKDAATRSSLTAYLRYMAKEVSGPAMHVQAVIDLLSRQVGIDNKEQHRLLGLAATEARRLSSVVRGSLELMSLRGNGVQHELKPLALDGLVSTVARAVAEREGAARFQTLVFESTWNGQALSHRQSLISMLNILLTNAFRYSPPGGEVHVRVYGERDSVTIDIEDAGPGVTSDEIARMGEPFFRGVAAIGIAGSGLGLATALELANHTQSSLRFQNSTEDGRGLIVSFTLPLAS